MMVFCVQRTTFRLRFFLLQMEFRNPFPENSMFGTSGKLGQTENIFSLTQFSRPTKHAIFRKRISEFRLKSKQTEPYFAKKSEKNQEESNNQWWTCDQWDLLPSQY